MVKIGKVESSPHYKEIVDLFLAGYGGTYIEKFLWDKYEEKISHTTLNKFKKKYLNVKAAARKQIQDQEKKKKDTQKKVKKAAKKEVEKQEYTEESLETAASVYVNLYNHSQGFISQIPREILFDILKEFLSDEEIPAESKIKVLIDLENLGVKHEKIINDIYKDDVIDVNINDNTENDFYNTEDILRFIDESDFLER